MKIKINNIEYEANPGETILDVCQRENIKIPTLCAHGKLKKEAVCRLCLVETTDVRNENFRSLPKLVASCATKVCENMEVVTESEKIKKAREINMELLWADHAGKCVRCKKNRRCELQKLAEEYRIENFHFVPRREEMTDAEEKDLLKDNWTRTVVDEDNPVIARTTEYCVECRRCINICPVKSYGFNKRAGEVVVGTPYNKTLDCIFCGACVKHCPTAALTDKNDLEKIEKELSDLNILAVAILDSAILKSVGLELEGIDSSDKLIAILRSLGFERVFDLADGLKIASENMLEEIQGNKLLLGSHCAAFNLYIEKYHPELVENLAKTKIPDEIVAEKIKTEYSRREKINPKDIRVISISSCTAKKVKKYENLDYILTVRELGRLVRKKYPQGIDSLIYDINLSAFDSHFCEDVEDGFKIMRAGGMEEVVKNKNSRLAVTSVNGMEDMEIIIDDIKKKKKKYDFVEAMICPGGCENGGGQAIKISNS